MSDVCECNDNFTCRRCLALASHRVILETCKEGEPTELYKHNRAEAMARRMGSYDQRTGLRRTIKPSGEIGDHMN